MNFKQINKPNMYVKTILMLSIVWIFTDISNINIYHLHVLIIDIVACFSFMYFAYHIFFDKVKNFKYYLKIGNLSMIYSVIIGAETMSMADTMSFKVFIISVLSCLIISIMGLVLSSSTYED